MIRVAEINYMISFELAANKMQPERHLHWASALPWTVFEANKWLHIGVLDVLIL